MKIIFLRNGEALRITEDSYKCLRRQMDSVFGGDLYHDNDVTVRISEILYIKQV
jgi:hypothetical protein